MTRKFFDDGYKFFVANIRRDVPKAEPRRADEHAQVLQQWTLVFLQLGALFKVGLWNTLA